MNADLKQVTDLFMPTVDPRLLGILVDYFSSHWTEINPAKLRQFYAKMKTPQTVAVVGEFMSAGSFDTASRKNILRRLFEKEGEIRLKDYLSVLQFSISRQQALLDIKSGGLAEPAGRDRGAMWKKAA